MKKNPYIFDACGLIAFLSDEEGADKVEKVLTKANAGSDSLYMNKINLLEIYYGIYREEGEEEAERVLETISNLPIKIIGTIKETVFKEAGRLKATYKISLADSIALAEASIRKGRLITSDHHELDRVEEKESINFYWIR